MASIEAHGIRAALPDGFEGRIFVRPTIADEVTHPVAHFATFPLPADVGDFGSGAVTLMRGTDLFVSLFDYGPTSLGRVLFARSGMPRSLGTDDFKPTLLRRGLGGQSGTQWFFTEAGRPFTLYAVLGSHRLRASLVPRLNQLLGALTLSPTSPAAPPGAVAAGSPADDLPSGMRWN